MMPPTCELISYPHLIIMIERPTNHNFCAFLRILISKLNCKAGFGTPDCLDNQSNNITTDEHNCVFQ